jgi:NDMA-dependent alcohol dehydrogenase
MRTRAAIVTGAHTPFEVVELELDPPSRDEVLIRYEAAGLCHSDLHLTSGDMVPRFPLVGGHEGAGVVEKVGPGVTKVAAGDHVVCSFMPACGHCRYCSTGRQGLCDLGARLLRGCMVDGTYRLHSEGVDYGAMCMLGTFSQYGVVSQYSLIKIGDDIPFGVAALVGCGVPTGWGTAVYAGGVRPGDTVVVYGAGGVGINAVQGAAYAGAQHVVVVDPVELKRTTALKLGATHAFSTADAARHAVEQLTRGQGADQALVTVGVVDEAVVGVAFDVVGKGGTVVIAGLANPDKLTVHISGGLLTLYEKTIKGTVFGSANPHYDIPRLLDLYQSGDIRLDDLISRTYELDEINDGYQDLVDGKNIRGLIVHDH